MRLRTILATSIMSLSAASPAFATVTGFLSGEQESGFNKICMYDVLGETYTLNVSSVALCPLSHKFETSTSRRNSQINELNEKLEIKQRQPYRTRIAKTGFFVKEYSQGFNKVCVYDVLGDYHTFNTSSVSLCPMSKKF